MANPHVLFDGATGFKTREKAEQAAVKAIEGIKSDDYYQFVVMVTSSGKFAPVVLLPAGLGIHAQYFANRDICALVT